VFANCFCRPLAGRKRTTAVPPGCPFRSPCALRGYEARGRTSSQRPVESSPWAQPRTRTLTRRLDSRRESVRSGGRGAVKGKRERAPSPSPSKGEGRGEGDETRCTGERPAPSVATLHARASGMLACVSPRRPRGYHMSAARRVAQAGSGGERWISGNTRRQRGIRPSTPTWAATFTTRHSGWRARPVRWLRRSRSLCATTTAS